MFKAATLPAVLLLFAFSGCEQPAKHPEVVFRECVLKQARQAATAKRREPTFAEAAYERLTANRVT